MDGTQYLRRKPARKPQQQPYSVLKWTTKTPPARPLTMRERVAIADAHGRNAR